MNKVGIAGTFVSVVGAGALALGFIQFHEDTKYESYLDSGKVVTICTGHTEPGLKLGETATPAMCEDLLNKDMDWVWATEDRDIHDVGSLPVWTRAAVASLIFRIGPSAFEKSSVLRYLNQGKVFEACRSILLYTKIRTGPRGDLVEIRGLVNRAADEYKLCMGEAW